MRFLVLFSLIFAAFSQACSSFGQTTNVVDLDPIPIFVCDLPSNVSDEQQTLICNVLRPQILEELDRIEEVIDQIFVGYNDDIPTEFLQTLSPALISVRFDIIDGPGGTPVTSGPTTVNTFPNAFSPDFAFTGTAIINLDIDDLESALANNQMGVNILHSVIHSMGFPTVFESLGLIGANAPDVVNYIGNDGMGFGIDAYRKESGNAFATFVPLFQQDEAHLNPFDPTFLSISPAEREISLPLSAPFCGRHFMSRTLRGMFADAGYQIATINSSEIIDLDGDGQDDDPLFVPTPGGEVVLGDINMDGDVDLLDVNGFVDALSSSFFVCRADINMDGVVNLLDVAPFVDAIIGGN